MNKAYEENGYFVVRDLFEKDELQELFKVLLEFHESWKGENKVFYLEKAINSAYITGTEHLEEPKRMKLFQFIGSAKIMNIVSDVITKQPTFMNTQLFFNPENDSQKNYWHRDPQYHLTIDEQKEALSGPEVIHFRIPLVKEPGIELVPTTHKRWDTDEELDVRLEQNNRNNFEDLTTGVTVELNAGDLLVFSGNMIHRGIYGMDRFSLDILFCDPAPELAKYAREDCLPKQYDLLDIEDPSAFLNTINLKENNKLIQ